LDERAADMFAIELLNGRQNATYTLADRANFRELADTAYKFGKENQIDPGHIVLNFANQSGKWGIGIEAAKVLQGEKPPASQVIGEVMWGGVNSEALPTDTIEFIATVTDSYTEFDKVAGSYVALR
jgi:hypothetical protein